MLLPLYVSLDLSHLFDSSRDIGEIMALNLSGSMYWATVDVVAQLGRLFVISNAHTADDEHIENI